LLGETLGVTRPGKHTKSELEITIFKFGKSRNSMCNVAIAMLKLPEGKTVTLQEINTSILDTVAGLGRGLGFE